MSLNKLFKLCFRLAERRSSLYQFVIELSNPLNARLLVVAQSGEFLFKSFLPLLLLETTLVGFDGRLDCVRRAVLLQSCLKSLLRGVELLLKRSPCIAS